MSATFLLGLTGATLVKKIKTFAVGLYETPRDINGKIRSDPAFP